MGMKGVIRRAQRPVDIGKDPDEKKIEMTLSDQGTNKKRRKRKKTSNNYRIEDRLGAPDRTGY